MRVGLSRSRVRSGITCGVGRLQCCGGCRLLPARGVATSVASAEDGGRAAAHEGGCADASQFALLGYRANLTLTLTLSRPSLSGHGEVRIRAQTSTRPVQFDSVGMRVLCAGADGRSVRFKQVTRTQDFQRVLSKVSERDLTQFFRRWAFSVAHEL